MELLDLIGTLVVLASALIVVVGTWTWVVHTHRAAVRRARERVQVHLDALAEQICDALAAADERRHAMLLGRYERLRDDLASCSRLRDLRRLEIRARADAAMWRARAGAEQALERILGAARTAVVADVARDAQGAALAWWQVARAAAGRPAR